MGEHKPLALKNRLIETRNKLNRKLVYDHDKMSVNEREIYTEWLTNVNELITICEERNKF